MYISGIVNHAETGQTRIVSALELKNIIMTEMNKRPTDFNNLYIRTVEVCFRTHYDNMPMQYTAIFPALKMTIFSRIFSSSYFCLRHRLFVHVRTAVHINVVWKGV